MEVDPGSMGQMDAGSVPPAYGNSNGYGQSGFEEEPPLLEELGIDFELIKQKVGGRGDDVIIDKDKVVFSPWWCTHGLDG